MTEWFVRNQEKPGSVGHFFERENEREIYRSIVRRNVVHRGVEALPIKQAR
jgi:hypothetical protein